MALLEEYLLTSKSNVAYLNLGRAYQKLGKCQEAKKALESALTAPVVDKPNPKTVHKKAHQFLAELDKSCASSSPTKQTAQTTQKPPAKDATHTATAKSGKDTGKVVAPPAAASAESSTSTWGWVAVGTGVALAAGATGLHLVANSKADEVTNFNGAVNMNLTQREANDAQDSVDTLNTVSLSMAVVSAAVVGTGVYLLLGHHEAAPASDGTVAVGVGADGKTGQITWQSHF